MEDRLKPTKKKLNPEFQGLKIKIPVMKITGTVNNVNYNVIPPSITTSVPVMNPEALSSDK